MNQGNLESKKDTGHAVQPKDCGFTKPHWCCVCVYVGVCGGCFSCMSGPQLVSGFSSCCVVLLVITGPDTQDRFLICHRWISWWTNQLNPGRPKFIPDPWFNNIFSLLPSSFLPFITPIQNSKCPTPDLQNSFLRHFSGCDHPAPDQSWNCSLARINGASVTAPKSFIRKSVCSKVKGSPLNTSMCVLLCACVHFFVCAGECVHVKVKKDFHSSVPLKLNYFIWSRNKQNEVNNPDTRLSLDRTSHHITGGPRREVFLLLRFFRDQSLGFRRAPLQRRTLKVS